MNATYWRSAADDEAMQDEHGFIWRAMLDTIDVDLAGQRVLDAGCNRGGFLRLLADRNGIAEGFGYDPAAGAIEDARRLAGFDAATARLAFRFVPTTGRGHNHEGRSLDWLAYYHDHKLLLRFTRLPSE